MQNKNKLWIDIRKLRQDRGWLQRETAKKLGVTRAYISSVENGRRGISMNMMLAIIRVFDVKYEDFLDKCN